MTNMNNDIYISSDVYLTSDPGDGLYESYIDCAECGSNIGAWQYDTQDSTVELFNPYWMCDPDNNRNVCECCYSNEVSSEPKLV